ncbi:regulatory protein [Terriglobus roseus]|uniref:Regulatory protein RecX n=2 Tax=Terriglobus roseus TaxID=392734 RepID=A0A1G7QV21_9BACT|nr:regulatory protein [Terriglobus roseus]
MVIPLANLSFMAFGRQRVSRTPLDRDQLMEYALKSLGARMQSVRDLRRKLIDRAEPGPSGAEAVDWVLAKLQELRYLSDDRFAADFTRLRQENRSFGRRRVQQDLQAKGIASEVIQTTLDEAYEGVDEQALVRQHLERRRIPPPTDEKSTARVLRRLTAAGFSSKAIFAVLRSLKSGEQALDRAEADASDDLA